MAKTVFQKFIDREIAAQIVFEDEQCIAFKDANPQAPVHCLIVPKKHIERLANTSNDDEQLLGHLLLTFRTISLPRLGNAIDPFIRMASSLITYNSVRPINSRLLPLQSSWRPL